MRKAASVPARFSGQTRPEISGIVKIMVRKKKATRKTTLNIITQ